jgi:isopentenyl diphosphate isomerase/L-lactate dehydrogenase-like FMN-dependent dehydrogenase
MPEVNEDLWRRVRESNFKFMMLTTDTQLMGKRENDVRNSFELPSHLKLENLTKYNSTTETSLKATKGSGLMEYAKIHKNNEIGWDIIPYIKKVSGLKVFAKGVMCYEDAKLAI